MLDNLSTHLLLTISNHFFKEFNNVLFVVLIAHYFVDTEALNKHFLSLIPNKTCGRYYY